MIETKTVDFKVKGKDGLVNVHTIQRHKPYLPMCFIRTITGHMLFCQENHPIWIKTSDDEVVVVEAKDVVAGQDKIWVDNTDIKPNINLEPTDENSDYKSDFYYKFNQLIDHNDKDQKTEEELNKIIIDNPNYFIGDNIYNFNLNMEFLKFNISDMVSVFFQFFPIKYKWIDGNHKNKTYSFNLISQFKSFSDYLNWGAYFDINNDNSWNMATMTDPNKAPEESYLVKDYVVVDQVISGIHDYQGYVYDLKTDSEEYMNNNVQTHNSFHCFYKDSTVLIKNEKENLIKTFEEIWNDSKSIEEEKFYTNDMSQYEKDLSNDNLYIYDNNSYTKVLKVIRHKKEKDEHIRSITLNSGECITTQSNHPHMVLDSNNNYIMCEAKNISHHKENNKQLKTTINYKKMFLDENVEESKLDLKEIVRNLKINENNPHIKVYKNKNDNIKILHGLVLNDNLYELSFPDSYKFIYNLINFKLEEKVIYTTLSHNSNKILFTLFCVLKTLDIDCEIWFVGNCGGTLSFDISVEQFEEINGIKSDEVIKNYTSYPLGKHKDGNPEESYLSINLSEFIDDNIRCSFDIDNDYLYDLTTESGTLTVNGIWTHNTGGAVEFKKIDILKELGLNVDSSEETHLKRLFNQVDNDLFCNNALTKIAINKSLFQDEYAIKKEGDIYKLPLGYFVLTTGEIILDATIEQPIELYIPTDYSETATTIELIYGQGAKILHIKSFSIAPEKIAQHLDSLVGGKSPYTTPESLLRKFHNDLEGFNNYDMTHLEVIVSSVLRNKLDPMIPARLKEPYNPETFSIKALPGVISWSLGLAYENISKALSTGLISDDTKNLSQIEKVLYGEPLSDLSHELLAAKRKKR